MAERARKTTTRKRAAADDAARATEPAETTAAPPTRLRTRKARKGKVLVQCPACIGAGRHPIERGRPCGECGGDGLREVDPARTA